MVGSVGKRKFIDMAEKEVRLFDPCCSVDVEDFVVCGVEDEELVGATSIFVDCEEDELFVLDVLVLVSVVLENDVLSMLNVVEGVTVWAGAVHARGYPSRPYLRRAEATMSVGRSKRIVTSRLNLETAASTGAHTVLERFRLTRNPRYCLNSVAATRICCGSHWLM